jgi:hypothetical protein
MDIQKIALASDEAVDALVGRVLKVLQAKQKVQKELLDALRLLFHVLTLRGVSSIEIPNDLIVSTFLLIDDETMGWKSRLLAASILSVIMPVGMPALQEGMTRYKDKMTPFLVRKLLQSSGDEKTFVSHAQHLLSTSLTPSPLRPTTVPLLAHFFRKYSRISLRKPSKRLVASLSRSSSFTSSPSSSNLALPRSSEPLVFHANTPLEWLDEGTLLTLTQNFETILLRTPAQLARDPNATNLFSVLSSSSKPNVALNDVDGQPSRAFFSALLDSSYLSEDQVSHHYLLQSLESILQQLYIPLIQLGADKLTDKISQALASFLEAVYKYVARVMDQVKFCQMMELKMLTGVSMTDPNAFFQNPSAETKELREARLSRGVKYPDLLQSVCIRLLDVVCRLDANRVDACWKLLSRSCLAMTGVETEFKRNEKENNGSGSGSHRSSDTDKSFASGPSVSSSATFLNSWHASLGVPAGLLLGFSTAFFYPATCSALFFAPSSLLSFGTSPERLHAVSALQTLSFALDHLLAEDSPLYEQFCANAGIFPFSVEFLFRSYFDSFLSLYYQDPFVAFETFRWLQKHALVLNGGVLNRRREFAPPLRLSTHINMHGQHLTFFECFYKIFLKMLAWHGMSLKTAFETSILPQVLTPYIHIELFHTLIDLPLLTCCMEMVEPEVRHIIMTTPNSGFNALASASSLLTSVVFSAHHQSQQYHQQQSIGASMPQYFSESSGSMKFGNASSGPSGAPPSPYSSGKFGSIPNLNALGQQAPEMAFGTGSGLNGPAQPSLLSPTGIFIDRYRSILNVILWNEGGVVGNLWESSGRKNISSSGFAASGASGAFSSIPSESPLAGFWNDCKITPRVLSACENAISSLQVLLKLTIEKSSLEQIVALVPVLLDRMDKSFPLNTFQAAIQTLLINSLTACFEKYPVIIIKLQPLIISYISESDTAALLAKNEPVTQHSGGASWRDELMMCLVWLIGKYASANIAGDSCNYQVMYDYDEALELLAYEKMSILSMEAAELHHAKQFARAPTVQSISSVKGPLDWKEYKKMKIAKLSPKAAVLPSTQASLSPTSRLLLVLSASLTKLASRCLPLASRVKLCLAKLLRYPKSQAPPESVLRWANHCLNVLKYPSLAAHIMDTSNPTPFENPSSETNAASEAPWKSLVNNHASIVSDSMTSIAPPAEEELTLKDFSKTENISVNLTSTTSVHTNHHTSLSFLLHRIDYNIRMPHDGSISDSTVDSAGSTSAEDLPDDLQYSWVDGNPVDSTFVANGSIQSQQTDQHLAAFKLHPFAL